MSTRTVAVSNAELLAAIKQLEAKIDRNRTELLDLVRLHNATVDARLDHFYHEQQEVLRLAETFTEEIMQARGMREDLKAIRRVLTPEQQAALNTQIAAELDSISEVGA